MLWAPYERALSSPGELPPARLVIHRQTSAMHDVRKCWKAQSSTGFAPFFTLHPLAVNINNINKPMGGGVHHKHIPYELSGFSHFH